MPTSEETKQLRRSSLMLRLILAEMRSMLALPEEVLARPGIVERITELAGTHEAINPPAPGREELLRMLA